MCNKWKIAVGIVTIFMTGLTVWKLSHEGVEKGIGSPKQADRFLLNDANHQNAGNLTFDADLQVDIKTRLFGEMKLLRSVQGEAEGQKAIQSMFAWLNQSPREETVSAIIEVLKSGENAFAFGRFAPGVDGFLRSYPNFRTALLDSLEKLDPQKAVVVGKDILDTSENTDEWALALRTLSRYAENEGDQAFLSNKVQELLLKETWLDDPTFSFLHAFDAAVAEGNVASVERLGELIKNPPNRPVSHAATIAIDRYFQMNPGSGTSYGASHPEFLESLTGFRATLMARANPGVANDMLAVDEYLESVLVPASEKQTFFQSFPNFNSTFSYNLITGSLLLSREEMRERSLLALNQFDVWLSEDRYPKYNDEITTARSRVAEIWNVEL